MAFILIDLQGAQTESRHRGLGRYALALATAMIRNNRGHDIQVLLNAAFPLQVASLRRHFRNLLPDAKIHLFRTPGRTRSMTPENAWRAEASALLREAFIDGLKPDVVFCPSLFEGFVDDGDLSVGKLSTVPVVVTIHDLIPLIYKDKYLDGNPLYAAFYMNKIAEIKRAAGLIAISQSSSSEATEYLGFPQEKVVNASEAAEPVFAPLRISEVESRLFLHRFGIDRPFVFYTGGADPRKNLNRMLEAFAALPETLRSRHQIVLSGKMPDGEIMALRATQRRLKLDDHQLIFTGYVTDSDLNLLFNLARAFVFPSLHEGFGLPILEAMQCGIPAIGANKSSVPEVIGLDEALFDPLSVADIAEKMRLALADDLYRERLITHGLRHAATFSWEASAEKALDGILGILGSECPIDQRRWSAIRDDLDTCETRLLEAIGAIRTPGVEPTEDDLVRLAQAIADNRHTVEQALRLRLAEPISQWRLEGPFDSSYSLAIVNRELARGLTKQGRSVATWSAEGGGDFAPSEAFLSKNGDLADMFARAEAKSDPDSWIVSRNMYPPRVTDMTGPVNALHNYAWEETGFPTDWVRGFNENLQFATVTSRHVKKLLIDNGVTVPLTVVGNGVDHWLSIDTDSDYRLAKKGFTFLHVSSCFPRKGADVLLESFGRAFTASDPVSLVIKTFANPHNEIERWLDDAKQRHPDYPEVTLIMGDLPDPQLKALYAQADVLVAPSRAEGYGLPLAEAALSGAAIIATGWSGQLDFCDPAEVDLIDYRFDWARTHAAVENSIWAEPDAEHLAALMRKVFEEPGEVRKARTEALKSRLLMDHKWSDVAARQIAAAANFRRYPHFAVPQIGWITTYNQRCGIATYSNHLLQVLDLPLTILVNNNNPPPIDKPSNVIQCWKEGNDDDLSELERVVLERELDMVVLQFNYGFFNLSKLNALLERLIDRGIQVIVTLHATIDPAHDKEKRLIDLKPALSRAVRLLVHSVHDMNRLKALGLIDNVSLLPHGNLTMPQQLKLVARDAGKEKKSRLIAAYGFFLPNKGITELIEAIHILRADGGDYRLRLVNAEYPAPISAQLIAAAKAQVARLGLGSVVEFHTRFLPDEESLALLSDADLIAYTYQDTAESASGAVRYGIASGVPVAVTPVPIFDEIKNIVYTLPGTSPLDIAQGLATAIASIKHKDAAFTEKTVRAARWRQAHSYPSIGRRLSGLLTALHRDKLFVEQCPPGPRAE